MSSVGLKLHLAPPRTVPVVSGYAECRMNELYKFSLKDLQRPKQDIVTYLVIVSTRRKNIYFFTAQSSEKPGE